MSERRSARDRKPKQSFSPDLYDLPKKTNKKRGQNSNSRNNNNGNGNGRGTNKSQDGQFNKWHEYLLRLRRHLAVLVKEQNYLELYQENYQFTATNISTSSAYSSSFGGKTNVVPLEVSKCQQRIVQAKQAILTVFEQISAENSTDTQWEQLQKQDEDGMVDVLDVLCSRCHGEDVEGNDILFCDRKGCHRAYHQGCLDPPIVVTEETLDPNLAWFCWQCECLDNCLDNCNERLETELMDWKELFPELKAGQKQSSGENEYGRSLDDDDEDDESFRSADATDSDEDEGSDRLQSEGKPLIISQCFLSQSIYS